MAKADYRNLPETRSEARLLGVTHYFTGKPCKYGHTAIRSTREAHCMECAYEAGRKWRAANPEKTRDSRAKWMLENPEKDREAKRLSAAKKYASDPEAARARGRAWRERNRDKNNMRRREKRALNRELEREIDRKWRKDNPEKVREARQKSYRKRRLLPDARLNASVAAGMRHSLNSGSKAGQKWEALAGFSVSELVRHLERRFRPGMSWANYGEWEIDHIIPLSAFNFQEPEDIDFKRAWSLSNLQPLWMAENRSKNDRLSAPFQPSLALAVPANDNEPKKDAA